MTGRNIIFLVLLLLATAWATFHLKYAMVRLESRADLLIRQIAKTDDEIHVLEADLALRTHPDRIVALTPDLGMVPMGVGALATVDGIPSRARLKDADRVLPVLLPSGAQVSARLKPLATRSDAQ